MNVTLATVQRNTQCFLRAHRHDLAAIDFVIGVSRGGLIPAVLIATALDKPLVAAYIDRQDRVYLDRSTWLRGKRLLLVDDIIRTGNTFKKMHVLLNRSRPKSIVSFTLYCLKDASVFPTWTRRIASDCAMPWDENRDGGF